MGAGPLQPTTFRPLPPADLWQYHWPRWPLTLPATAPHTQAPNSPPLGSYLPIPRFLWISLVQGWWPSLVESMWDVRMAQISLSYNSWQLPDGASLVSKGSLCLSVCWGCWGWGTSPALGDLAGSWAGGPGALPRQTLGWGRIQVLSPLCCAPPPGPAEAHPLPGLGPQLCGATADVAVQGGQGP